MNNRLTDQSKAVVWQIADKIRLVRVEESEAKKKRDRVIPSWSHSLSRFSLSHTYSCWTVDMIIDAPAI